MGKPSAASTACFQRSAILPAVALRVDRPLRSAQPGFAERRAPSAL